MQPLRWYVNRLRAMSLPEVGARGRRHVRNTLEGLGAFRAERPPEPGQLQTPFRWPIPASADVEPYVAEANRILAGTFELFGDRFEMPQGPVWNVDPKTGVSAPLEFGKTLDYRDGSVVGDIKYVWELNRHLEVVPLAQAYALTGEHKYLDGLRALISSWIEQCPYPLGPNWCSSLELAIRLVNWQFAYVIAGGAESQIFTGGEGERFKADWLRSIYQHVHFVMGHLSGHSSANNHLIGELTGAYVAASTWRCWPEMETWRRRAASMLVEQVERQTYADGVNKEQAVWYQQFVMYFLLVAGLVGERSAAPLPREYWEALRRMTDFVDALVDVRGRIPMIGDADDGIVFCLEPRREFNPFRALFPIGGRLFDSPALAARFPADRATAEWLCDDLEPVLDGEHRLQSRQEFAEGGYYVLGRFLGESRETRIVADAGPLGFLSIAAHGHADCLAFTLSVAGRELLVDPGTYSYHTERDWRDYFRGTAAHNTVRVDGIDQSGIAGPFLWDRKAVAAVDRFESSASLDRLRARHFGYRHLADPVVHIRDIAFDKRSGRIDVVDEIECREGHVVERYWHFAEVCDVTPTERGVTAVNDVVRISLETLDSCSPLRVLRGSAEPKGGWISRRFGHKQPATSVVFTDEITGACTLRTRITIEVA